MMAKPEGSADVFRKIDGLAAEARRRVQEGEPSVAGSLLVAIQAVAQAGLRDLLGEDTSTGEPT